MNLDDLKNEWLARDQRLENSIRLNTQWLREAYVDRHRGSVQRWALFGFLVELPCYLLTLGALGEFIAHHAGELKFLVPALLLGGWGIAMSVALVRQFSAMHRLNLGEPVVTLQKKLVAIKMTRLRTIKWGFLSGLIVWCAPFFIVIGKGVFNADLYAVSGFLVFNLLATGTLALLIVLLFRRYGARWQRLSFVGMFLDNVAGYDLKKANAFLKQLSSFRNRRRKIIAIMPAAFCLAP